MEVKNLLSTLVDDLHCAETDDYAVFLSEKLNPSLPKKTLWNRLS